LGEALRLSAVNDENLSRNLASEDSLSTSSSSLDSSDLSEDTTSSDSNLSSEDSEDELGPEEASSRREGPERVAALSRQENRPAKKPCRQFAKTGHCQRGHRCRFLHELPGQNGQAKVREWMQGPERKRERRLGLFQAVGAYRSFTTIFLSRGTCFADCRGATQLLGREKKEEDRRVMQAISWLGEKGVLDEHDAPGDEEAKVIADK
jgi:hypothetical protein